MFLHRLTSRALREENARLESSLRQAQDALDRYRQREHDLADVLVSARTDARALLDDARAEARAIVERAVDESKRLTDTARTEVARAEHELTRLRDTQRALHASLQQSLAVLAPDADAPKADPPIEDLPVRDHASDGESQPLARSTSDVGASMGALDVGSLPPYERASLSRGRPVGTLSAEDARSNRVTPVHLMMAVGALTLGVAATLAWPGWRARATPPPPVPRVAVSPAPVSPAPSPGPSHVAPDTSGAPIASDSGIGPAPRVESAPSTGSPRTATRLTGLTVAIDATRPVWLRASVDGRQELARLLHDREHVDLVAEREVILRAGDAGAVVVAVNGGASVAMGRPGAVVTRRMTASAVAAKPARPLVLALTTATAQSAPPARVLPTVAGVASAVPPAVTGPAVLTPAPAAPPQQVLPPPAPPARAGAPAAAPQPAGLTPEETEVLRAHESYFDALRRGDQGAIRRVLAATFTASGLPAANVATGLTVSNVSVQISGVGAIVSGTATRQAADGGVTSPKFLFSELWTNTDGAWQLLSVRFLEAPIGR